MKPQNTITCALVCGTVAFVLIMIANCMDVWWHAPSANPSQTGVKVMLPYQLRGLWNFDSDTITKYMIGKKIFIVENSTVVQNTTYTRGDVPGWFNVVKAFETVGCILTFVSLAITVAWKVMYHRSKRQCSGCFAKYALVHYILSGIFILLGIIIIVGKTESEQIAWGPSVAGFGGAFCIMAACFIRWDMNPPK